MTVFWAVLVSIAVVVVLLFALMDRAKKEDSESRRIQHTLSPFDDITTTRPGE
jgi:uncharacterized membrane protein